jgi:hypothetical protein
MEAIAGPGTRKEHATCALDVWQAGLGRIRGRAAGRGGGRQHAGENDVSNIVMCGV